MAEPRVTNNAEQQILDFIVETYACDDAVDFQSELVRSEIIDSYGIVELIEFIEQNFAIRFPDEEIKPDNFRTVTDIATCVARIRVAA